MASRTYNQRQPETPATPSMVERMTPEIGEPTALPRGTAMRNAARMRARCAAGIQ